MNDAVLTPPAARTKLAERMISLRKQAGLSQAEASKISRLARSTIIDLENANTSNVRISTVAVLLNAYEVPSAQQVELIKLAEQARAEDLYPEYRDVAPNFAKGFFEREVYARRILIFQAALIPGLFQLPDYARAVTRARHPERSEAEIGRSAQLRDARQGQVLGINRPEIIAVIDELALLRGVSREQLDHLIVVSKLEFVRLLILPREFGMHAAPGESFNILLHPDSPEMDGVYLEDMVEGDYYERGTTRFDQYLAVFEQQLMTACLSEDDSRARLVTLRGA